MTIDEFQKMRDDLAQHIYGMAMASLMAEFPRMTVFEIDAKLGFVAKLSYRAADAMMAERAK